MKNWVDELKAKGPADICTFLHDNFSIGSCGK